MANRKDFDNYIMACVRKYEENHPNDVLKATKKVDIPVKECVYCNGSPKYIYNIPFYRSVGIENNELVILDDNKTTIKINYCPMCGRKL